MVVSNRHQVKRQIRELPQASNKHISHNIRLKINHVTKRKHRMRVYISPKSFILCVKAALC